MAIVFYRYGLGKIDFINTIRWICSNWLYFNTFILKQIRTALSPNHANVQIKIYIDVS